MSRYDALKRLDRKSRNQLRNILSTGGDDAVIRLSALRSRLGKQQSDSFESVLASAAHINAPQRSAPFPRNPPFTDRLHSSRRGQLQEILLDIEHEAAENKIKLSLLTGALERLDEAIAQIELEPSIHLICEILELYGWSHAVLRKLVLVRELLPESSEVVEDLVRRAGLQSNAIVVASLIHAYSPEQNYLTIKRSVLNIVDRGSINRFSRTIARTAVQPFAKDGDELASYLSEARKCSLLDAVIIANFNAHLFEVQDYPNLGLIVAKLGKKPCFERLLSLYSPTDPESEYSFYQQSSAWLEYEAVKFYRILIDGYYDASREGIDELPARLKAQLDDWVGQPTLRQLVDNCRFTAHSYFQLGELETSGTVSRSAIFNYWLYNSEGQIGLDRAELMTLMGLTRDLARTVPIAATRTAARLSKDRLVKLILLLLLAKRSPNELDAFQLRKILEEITIKEYGGSLVKLVEAYQVTHPYIAEYIYDVATEDFLAKLNKLTPHLSDIPETRASLHEWMARKTGDEHYLERARAVRIDHQLNRVRNEIDDHRIYVDPSRFSSWIADEMMIDLNNALLTTGAGKKTAATSSDDAVLSMVMRQCYSAFCSNVHFGIASYIGRRIRHGTFHGHLYSSVINQIETTGRFAPLLHDADFLRHWNSWKDQYNRLIEEIVKEKLHVQSKAKPHGLLHPDVYSNHKQDIVEAAVKNIVSNYVELKSTEGLDLVITDYCWRLAESDLAVVTSFLKSQRATLQQSKLLDDVIGSAPVYDRRLAAEFKRELVHLIDNRLSSICGWFKRPSNLAPKASLALLYDAVVREVQDTVPTFDPKTESSPHGDMELVGGIYHLVYDSFAVVVSNAARHGDPDRPVRRNFSISSDASRRKGGSY